MKGGTSPMMYLKKLWHENQDNLSIEEAQKLIANGKEICAAISQDEQGYRTSFGVEGVREVSEYQDLIIIRDNKQTYPLNGWDDNVREIHVVEFVDYTEDSIIRDHDEARRAVEDGHKVRATDWRLKTSPIARFLSSDLFETASGSRYRMI